MKLQQLRFFLAVVDNGLNITAASERLFTSQPGVSKQIRMLEDELGLSLFQRAGKSLSSLTPAGARVADRARVILREVENIKQMAGDLRGEATGQLSIATTHTQARYVLPPVVAAFRRRYPEVALDLHQGTSEQIAEMLAQAKVDLAIATGGGKLFENILRLPAYCWDRTVLVPPGHELAGGDRLTLRDLARFPLVTYVFSFHGESSFKQAFAAQGLEPNVVFTARDADVIKTYVRLGLGVGVVASMAHDESDCADLVALDARGLFPRLTTWVGFHRDRLLRDFSYDFIALFAPHLNEVRIGAALATPDQNTLDGLFADVDLPVRGGCCDHKPKIKRKST